jgi:tetratricopeptide (TPR) repeat protein
MKVLYVTLAVLYATLPCASQSGSLSNWTKLLNPKDAKAARELCTGFEQSKVLAEQVEAEKCLANVTLIGADTVRLQNDENGHPIMFDEWIPEAIDESLSHLNRGIQLAPQDLSIHQGRLHVLEISKRYSDMVKALDESSSIYKGKEAPDAWLAYASELNDLHQYKVALDFSQVMDKHYPDNPDIVSNVGAFLSILGRDKEAIPYLEKAVEMAPTDPINVWDLAREYDFAGQPEKAETWYQKALALDSDAERKKNNSCMYAEFIERKLHDLPRACSIQKQDCPSEKQTACSPPTAALKNDQ